VKLKRKLELMKRYDFHGFGNCLATIGGYQVLCACENISNKDLEKYIKGLYESLGGIKEFYSQIDFKELEEAREEDEDFATLFKVREALPKLEKTINNFAFFVRNNGYSVSKDDEEYENLRKARIAIYEADNYKGIAYRLRVRELEKKLERSDISR
jgi:hypothetical protein